MAGLAVHGATVRLGGATILDDVSVQLRPGTVTAIIGPNGAGKSTLLSVAAGVLAPHRGTVHLGEHDVRALGVTELARRRAMMPQGSTVAFPFTVREVVAMGRTAFRSARHENYVIAEKALATAGVESLADRTVTTLSGGENQRVAFARVVAQAEPVGPDSVILLDEPTSAMDIAHAEAALTTARDLAARGGTVGIVLHDLDAAASYADQVVLMWRGRIHRAGTVPEVCTDELLSEVYGTPIEVVPHGTRLRVGPRRDTS